MNPFQSSAILLINFFFHLAAWLVLLRFLLQLVRADFYNPVSQAIAKATNPLLLPLRRVIPGFGGIDVASLVLLLAVEILGILALGLVVDGVLVSPLRMALWAPLGIVNLFLNFYLFAIFVMIVLSWVAPGSPSPVVHLIYQLTEPSIAPFRKLLPPMGGLDLSPMFTIVAILVAKEFVRYAAIGVYLDPTYVVGF